MYLPEKQIYRFDDVEVDLSRECLCLDGEEIHLRQKAFQVLVYLLQRRERLVSKSELFEAVWPNTAVTDDVLVQCVKEIRRAIGDDTHNQRFIKTVPKSGYRFIGTVEDDRNGRFTEEITRIEFEIEEEFEKEPKEVLRLVERPRSFSARYLVAASVVLVAITIFYFALPSTSKTSDVRLPLIDGRKTVAVMFFDNQSKSISFDWLREGLADMLIAGLSRSEKLTVLSREQLFYLLDRAKTTEKPISLENAKELARKSQAEYFVEGSFAQIGEAIRIDVRLRDTQTGDLLATESLTVEKAEQLLSQIDLISLKISNRLGVVPAEKRDMARVMTNNLEAYRFYSLAVEKAQAYHTIEAVKLFEKSIELDPDFAMALARIGYTYAVTTGDTEKGKPYLEKAFRAGERLTDKDRMNITAWYAIANLDFSGAIKSYREIIDRFPFESEAYFRLARLLRGENRQDEAIDVLKQGLAIDPEASELYNSLGTILSGKGRHADAIAAHERYVALSPNEPNAYDSLGLSYQASGNYAKAIENYEIALRLKPDFEIAIVHLGNTRVRLGQYNDAIAAYRRYIDAASAKIEKSRGYDCVGYIHLQKGEVELADREVAETQKIQKGPTWNSYLISMKRGQVNKAKNIGTNIGETFLSNLGLTDRGSRANRRLELYYTGTVALNNGETDKALEYFHQTLTYPPPVWHYTDYEDCLAGAFLKLERFDEAIEEYGRILKINPNYPLAHFHLGQAYQAKGLTDQSRTSYQTFLDIWTDADQDIPEVVAARKFLSS